MLFFKKKKEEEEQLGNIFCELIWDKNIKDKIELIGTNLLTNQRVLCAANVFERQSYHSTRPSSNIYIPRIVYEIDWKFIFKDDLKLKSFKISFYNYMSSTREYSVNLKAINNKNKEIIDSFTSTIKVFIDPFELTDNISKFLHFAESYK